VCCELIFIMDTTFGHKNKELLMDHVSAAGSTSHSFNSSKQGCVTNSYNNTSYNNNQYAAHVDEAYKRLGQRLSLLAHGGTFTAAVAPLNVRLDVSATTAFHSGDDQQQRIELQGNKTIRTRTNKNVLQRLTIHAKESFATWQHQHQQPNPTRTIRQPQDIGSSVQEQHHLHSSDTINDNTNNKPQWLQRKQQQQPTDSKGFLAAVLEGHSESTASHSQQQQQQSWSVTAASLDATTARGTCLTVPSLGVANNGLDNEESNLICHEQDVLVAPKRSFVHDASPSSNLESAAGAASSTCTTRADYRIQSLLGQGTFAQVFQCVHVQTGRTLAIKIVKNKPAYTRQAAVEVDVYCAVQDQQQQYMVNLDCYFVYKSHLCLVFEVLSLNLYEVLKRRQFRGLPLSLVQTIVQQAAAGVKDLSQTNVVHGDIKPENILLVSDSVAQWMIRAGGPGASVKEKESSDPRQQNSEMNESVQTSGKTTALPGFHGTEPTNTIDSNESSQKIKLIDFGSACFEGHTSYAYIQSRFYRSPEVLLGLPYDSAIDIWSLGCVAAELFLGLPILPGVQEHDQLVRIHEMIGTIPDWMLEQGSKATKYYLKYEPGPAQPNPTLTTMSSEKASPISLASPQKPSPAIPGDCDSPSSRSALQWRIKSQQEYILSSSNFKFPKLVESAKLTKFEQRPGSRYFKRKRLGDIMTLDAPSSSSDNKELLNAFIHFLYGVLDPDPWKRWTAVQICQHPFLTGDFSKLKLKTPDMVLDVKEENQASFSGKHHGTQPLADASWRAYRDFAKCNRRRSIANRIDEAIYRYWDAKWKVYRLQTVCDLQPPWTKLHFQN
jgi:serine/threonine protein kinase